MKLVITEAVTGDTNRQSIVYAVSDYRCQMAGPVALVRDYEMACEIGARLFGEHACIEHVQAEMPVAWGVQYNRYIEARIETYPLSPKPEIV